MVSDPCALRYAKMKPNRLIIILISLLVSSVYGEAILTAKVRTNTKIVKVNKVVRFSVSLTNTGTEAMMLPEALTYKGGRLLPNVFVSTSRGGEALTLSNTGRVHVSGPKGSTLKYTRDVLQPGKSATFYFEWIPTRKDLGNVEVNIQLPKNFAAKGLVHKLTVIN